MFTCPNRLTPLLACIALAFATGTAGCVTASSDKEPEHPDFDPSKGTEVRLELVQLLISSGNYDNAMPMLRRVLEEDPDSAPAHHYMGVALANQGHSDLAAREFRTALKHAPNLTSSMDRLASLLAAEGKFDQALRWSARAVELVPDNSAFHNNHAYILFLAERDEEAVAAYKEAIALDPSSRLANNNLGFAYARLGRIDDAQKVFEQVFGPARAQLNVGVAYELLGRQDEAQQAYLAALELDPNLTVAAENLAILRNKRSAAVEPQMVYENQTEAVTP